MLEAFVAQAGDELVQCAPAVGGKRAPPADYAKENRKVKEPADEVNRLELSGFDPSDSSLVIPTKAKPPRLNVETLEMERHLAGCRARSLRQLAEWCRRELRETARADGLVIYEDSWCYFGHNAPARLRVRCEARPK